MLYWNKQSVTYTIFWRWVDGAIYTYNELWGSSKGLSNGGAKIFGGNPCIGEQANIELLGNIPSSGCLIAGQVP